jgi:hypothetical protein
VGNGNIDVGSETPTRKPGRPTVECLSGSNGSSELRIEPSVTTAPLAGPSGICGAMSQQGSEFLGNVSAQQKFVRLVGCGEPKLRPRLEARQYSNPLKR